VAHEELSKRLFENDLASLTDEVAASLGLKVHSRTWPLLDVTIEHSAPIRLKFTCDNWDDQPPAIQILSEDGSAWTGKVPGNVFNSASHPHTKRPFICMRGSREYHSIHTQDAWANYRGKDGMNLFGILMQLNTHWRKVAN
jgi:hypothetical protein